MKTRLQGANEALKQRYVPFIEIMGKNWIKILYYNIICIESYLCVC